MKMRDWDGLSLTMAECKWVDNLLNVNSNYMSEWYIRINPANAAKSFVAIFNEDFHRLHPSSKPYSIWSPLSDQGNWQDLQELPEWAGGIAQPLLVEDGFTLEEVERAQEIIDGL